jgi:hypothetical protein
LSAALAIQVPFDSQHPRGAGGRFAAKGRDHGNYPSLSSKPNTTVPTRTLTKPPSWQRLGASTRELPLSVVGDRRKQHEAGTFLVHEFKPQIPASMTVQAHQELVRHLAGAINTERYGTITRAAENGYIPAGVHRASVLKAYQHAAKLALHDFGIAEYSFRMDDHQKAEMTPLVPFIRYARRRLKSVMLGQEKGAWRPYRAEFGQPFKDGRKDKVTGAIRLRMKPNDVLVKVAGGIPPIPKPADPGVIAPAQAGSIDRFARYRKAVAMKEAIGEHDLHPLTAGQRMQRVLAARKFAQDRHSHVRTIQPGQPGSIAGTGLTHKIDMARGTLRPRNGVS